MQELPSALAYQGALRTQIKMRETWQRHNQQHAYIVGNCIRLATEAAKSTKISYAQDFLHPEQQQVFILQIHWGKRTKALQHRRKLKDD
jgi:hypothetical protein